jgi:hypothetical protein
MPNSGDPNALLAVMWDDLDGEAGPNVGTMYYYQDIAQNRFIVSWVDWAFYSTSANFSIQVILDGDDNSIKMQYMGAFDQTDVSVGIENHDGTDGLPVTFNAAYVHDQLAILYFANPRWLSTDLSDGFLAPGAPAQDFDIIMDASELTSGTYTGAINIESNDPDEPMTSINVTFVVGGGGGGCVYIPGDINNFGGANGIDVTFGVSYFKGGAVPPIDCNPPCTLVPDGPDPGTDPDPAPDPFFAAGDVNGNCQFNGIDVTYFVAYLKEQQPALLYCPTCPPASGVAPAIQGPSIKAKAIKGGNIE